MMQACTISMPTAPQLIVPAGQCAQLGATVPTTSTRPVAVSEVQPAPTQLPTRIRWTAQWDLPTPFEESAGATRQQSVSARARPEEPEEVVRLKKPEGSTRPEEPEDLQWTEEPAATPATLEPFAPTPQAAELAVQESGGLFLPEEKAQVNLAQEGDAKDGVWVLDSGATSHMTARCSQSSTEASLGLSSSAMALWLTSAAKGRCCSSEGRASIGPSPGCIIYPG